MDILFICRSAQEGSVIGNVGLALEAQKAGQQVAVVFTGEVLAALAGQSFNWSPLLIGRDIRARISKNAKNLGIPANSAKDDRWTDMRRLVQEAKTGGLALWACPLWSQLLGVDGRLPEALERVDMAAYIKALRDAKTI